LGNIYYRIFIYVNWFTNRIFFNYISILVGAVAFLTLFWVRKQIKLQDEEAKQSKIRHDQQIKATQSQTDELKNESTKNDISRAWEIIGRKAIGNSGKIEALQVLAKYKDLETNKQIPLVGIDMSTKTHGGEWDDLEKTKIGKVEFVNHNTVKERVYLQGLNLSKTTIDDEVNLTNANFNGADLERASFEGAYLYKAKFEGADLIHRLLVGCVIHLHTTDCS